MFRPEVLVFMVPIVAIVMGIGTGMLALFLNYKKRKEMYALYHQERMAAIDKGIELPPLPDSFLNDEDREEKSAPAADQPAAHHRHLLAGLVLSLLGAAIMLALYVEFKAHYLWGLVLAAIGLAHLIYYFVVGKKIADSKAGLEPAEK